MCRLGCNLNPFGVGWGETGNPSRWSTYKLKLIPTRSHYCLLLSFFFTDSTCIDHESFCPDCPPCPRRSGPYFGGCGRPALASTHLGQYQSLFGVPELLFICRHCKWKGASHPSQTRTLFVSVRGSTQIVHPSEGFMYALAPFGKAGSTRSSFTMSFTAWANCWCVSCWSTAGWFIKPFAPRWRARAFGAWPPLMITVVGASCTPLVGTASGLDGLVLPVDFNFPAFVGVVDFLSVNHQAKQVNTRKYYTILFLDVNFWLTLRHLEEQPCYIRLWQSSKLSILIDSWRRTFTITTIYYQS